MTAAGADPSANAPAAARADDERRALAWELKQRCYAALNSEPQRVQAIADEIGTLVQPTDSAAMASATKREIHAVAAWLTGVAHVTRGRMTDALAALGDAAQAFHDLGQRHHEAQTRVPMVIALSMLGRHDEAAECAEQARAEFVARGDLHAASKASLNLGSLHLRRNAYALAARHYHDAALLFARVGDREHSIMADIGLGDALAAQGDFDEALHIYTRASLRAHRHGFPVLEAVVEESVALLDLARGRYRGALAGFEGSRSRYEKLGMPQHLAIAEKQLADAYLELRLLPEALALYDEASERFRSLEMLDEQGWTLAQRGRAEALSGRLEDAAATLRDASALFLAQHSEVGAATVALAQAELALAAQDAPAAERLAEQAARGFGAAHGVLGQIGAELVAAHALLAESRIDEAHARFTRTLERARDLALPPFELRGLIGRGLCDQAAGHRDEARAAFTAAVERFEEQRRALPGDEIRSAFLGDHLRPFEALLRMALEDQAVSGSADDAERVLEHLDRFRARALGERLAQPLSDESEPRIAPLRARLSLLYRRARRLEDEGEHSPALAADIRRTEHELLEHARRERLAAPALATASAPDEFHATALRALLGEDEAIVEYGVLDGALFACTVTRSAVVVHRAIAEWPQVVDAIRATRFQIETLRTGAAVAARHLPTLVARTNAHLARLHALVWAPLADTLQGHARVLVVPHAQLAGVPFAALHDGTGALAQRHALAVAPSARLALRGLAHAPVAPRRVVALGASERLPRAEHEARQVAGLFVSGQAFVGDRATAAVLQTEGARADAIHIACHAHFRADNPLFSALHLADDALTAETIEGMQLASRLVVLGGCETGLAGQGAGDEMFGIVRAFFVAGAARVLASLWPVDDAVTEQFMATFYGQLRNGAAPSAALREAGATIRSGHPHPFHWAAFTLYGGW